jgi:hypothetical protein
MGDPKPNTTWAFVSLVGGILGWGWLVASSALRVGGANGATLGGLTFRRSPCCGSVRGRAG